MGQAKARGTFEQRRAEAVEREEELTKQRAAEIAARRKKPLSKAAILGLGLGLGIASSLTPMKRR